LVLFKVASKLLKQHDFTAFLNQPLHHSGTSSKKQALHMHDHKLAVLLRSHPILHMKLYMKVKKIAAFPFEISEILSPPTSPLQLFAMSLQVKDVIAERLEVPFSSIRLTGRLVGPGQSKTSAWHMQIGAA
jgi:hypothetical protein